MSGILCGARSRAFRARCVLAVGHDGPCHTGAHFFAPTVNPTSADEPTRQVKSGAQPPSTVINGLTIRQRQIAWLIAHETSFQGMAEELGISYSTVKDHLQRLYDQLQVSSREGLLVRILLEQRMTLEQLTSEVMP